MKKTITLKESELVYLVQRIIEENVNDLPSYDENEIISFYKDKVEKSSFDYYNAERKHKRMVENLKMVNDFFNPKFGIVKIKTGDENKDYYRLQGSFPYEGKKNRIVAHVGMVKNFKDDLNGEKLKKAAKYIMQKNILEKYPIIKQVLGMINFDEF